MYMISTIQETTPPIDTGMGGSDTKSEGSFDSMGEGTKAVDEGAADNKEEKEESAPEQKYGSLQLQLEHNEDNDDNDDCCLRMCKGRRCSCCGKCIARWPRTFAIFFGVVFPLWLLIALSIFFGYFLAELEAPNEISQNNNIMAAQAQVLLLGSLAARAAEVIPTICFELFLLGLPVTNIGPAVEFVLDNTDPFQAGARQQTSPVVGAILSDDLIVVNKTAMYEFMQGCGDVAGPITEALLRRADDVSDIRTTSLTFNWIRCGPWANGLGSSGLLAPRPVDELRPEAQQKIYNQTWYDDQQQLFDKYLEEYMEANLTVYEDYLGANLTILAARLQAFQDSIGNATGGSKCFLNAPGSAWFWFTVMTTIGYGNQAPETTGGRALIYSLGFLSILAFAGILAAAGNIVSAIFDDAVDRIKLHSLTTPWVACVVWGAVYYSWMGFIAAHTKRWKEEDLDVDLSLKDGYWFSFISTTTVGLGDIFLEPEVIQARDLVTFPLLFLVGFVLLSSFLGKFSEQALHMYGSVGRKRIIDVLLERIKVLDGQDGGNDGTSSASSKPPEQTGDDLPVSSFIVK